LRAIFYNSGSLVSLSSSDCWHKERDASFSLFAAATTATGTRCEEMQIERVRATQKEPDASIDFSLVCTLLWNSKVHEIIWHGDNVNICCCLVQSG
jgi:hypothetical protein